MAAAVNWYRRVQCDAMCLIFPAYIDQATSTRSLRIIIRSGGHELWGVETLDRYVYFRVFVNATE